MASTLRIDIRLTEKAREHINALNIQLPLEATCPQDVLQQVRAGDHFRISDTETSPWLVVLRRGWSIGETATLTLWLDVPVD